jgi:ABC-type sugar transport system ATPase subunit
MTRARSAISATGLRKSFGDHAVLDGIDLDVAEGTVFALLGPNVETLRGLLMGTPIGDSGLLAVAWSVGIGLGGCLWAKRLFKRDLTP